MVFISAGHNPKGIKVDPGAIGNGYHEANLTVEFRDLVIKQCLKLGLKVIQDKYNEIMNSNQINEILDSGRDKTMQIAKEKTYEVFRKVGFGRY